MKNDILGRLSAVLSALNSVSVCGKANLANLSGSITMLEEVAQILNDAEIAEATKSEAAKSAEK